MRVIAEITIEIDVHADELIGNEAFIAGGILHSIWPIAAASLTSFRVTDCKCDECGGDKEFPTHGDFCHALRETMVPGLW